MPTYLIAFFEVFFYSKGPRETTKYKCMIIIIKFALNSHYCTSWNFCCYFGGKPYRKPYKFCKLCVIHS